MRPLGAALLLGLTAEAPRSTVLPGLGPHDPRVPVDLTGQPWAAMARLQVPGVSKCTAVMVGPITAWTAAHCMWGPRLQHFVAPGSVHILTGYAGGDFTHHSVAIRYRIAPGFDPQRPDQTRGLDIAELTLAAPVILASSAAAPDASPIQAGAILMLGGYGQDRSERATADPACQAVGPGVDGGANPVLLHACAGTRGTSGGPVLARDGAGWRLVGVEVAAFEGGPGGVAVPVAAIRSLLPESSP